MSLKNRSLSRRDFLKIAAVGAGGALLGGCKRPAQMTAFPSPSPTPPPVPSVPTATSQLFPTVNPTSIPDTILVNGRVVTMDSADTIAQAVAIAGNQILKTGSDADIRALAGAATKVVDLSGRTLTPGMIDAHNHFQLLALYNSFYTAFMPPAIKTIADLQKKLAEVVATTTSGEWIVGYYMAAFDNKPPTRRDLDPVSPHHPVWLMHIGGHYGSANSLALQKAGITASTPDPTGGIIDRDSSGEPSGVFYNHRAMDLLRSNIPPYTNEAVREGIRNTEPIFAACGVTSFQDNNVRGVDTLKGYYDAGQKKTMFLRGDVYYTLEYPSDLDTALNQVEHYEDPFVRFAGYKFLLDGQTTTAYTHEPHKGASWNMSTWEVKSFKQTVRTLHDTGFQICTHCGGDAAVDMALDAYEEAQKANPRPDARHRIEHAVITTPQATGRIKDLGVVISTNPTFIRMSGDTYVSLLSEKQLARVMMIREWLDADIPVALGSDSPTTLWYSPQATIAAAMARVTLTNKVLGADQCITFQEAMRAHTMGSAYAAHEEKIKGSLEPGKLADLVIWTNDPYKLSVKDLLESTIDLTMVDGKVVYEKT